MRCHEAKDVLTICELAIQATIKYTIPLCICALGVTLAFKMRFWNIGAEGQTLAGCLATAACMILLADKLPNWLLICTMVLSAIAAGADGLIIEVHNDPPHALCDGAQSLRPEQFEDVARAVRRVRAAALAQD